MREIKYKAWDVYKKKFIPNEVWTLYPEPMDRAIGVMIQDWEDYKTGESFYPEYQVLVGYTGLKDKNGKEIYEGDIIQNRYHHYGRNKTYNGYTNRRAVRWISDLTRTGFNVASTPYKEVVGNIYENPELIAK